MSPLAAQLIAALRAQGYGIGFDADDLIVTHDRRPGVTFRIPRFALADGPQFELVLGMAIGGLTARMGFVPDGLHGPGDRS